MAEHVAVERPLGGAQPLVCARRAKWLRVRLPVRQAEAADGELSFPRGDNTPAARRDPGKVPHSLFVRVRVSRPFFAVLKSVCPDLGFLLVNRGSGTIVGIHSS
jgi:hypothetical protein